MVLNSYRAKADSMFRPFAKAFSGISPNALSGVSLVCAALMMLLLIFWPHHPFALIIALILVLSTDSSMRSTGLWRI